MGILSALEYSRVGDRQQDSIQFFEELVLRYGADEKLCFLDVEQKKFIIIKKIECKDAQGVTREKRIFSKTYDLDCVVIDIDGRLICDFDNVFNKEYNLIEEQIHIKDDEVRRENELLKERLNKAEKNGRKDMLNRRHIQAHSIVQRRHRFKNHHQSAK